MVLADLFMGILAFYYWQAFNKSIKLLAISIIVRPSLGGSFFGAYATTPFGIVGIPSIGVYC